MAAAQHVALTRLCPEVLAPTVAVALGFSCEIHVGGGGCDDIPPLVSMWLVCLRRYSHLWCVKASPEHGVARPLQLERLLAILELESRRSQARDRSGPLSLQSRCRGDRAAWLPLSLATGDLAPARRGSSDFAQAPWHYPGSEHGRLGRLLLAVPAVSGSKPEGARRRLRALWGPHPWGALPPPKLAQVVHLLAVDQRVEDDKPMAALRVLRVVRSLRMADLGCLKPRREPAAGRPPRVTRGRGLRDPSRSGAPGSGGPGICLVSFLLVRIVLPLESTHRRELVGGALHVGMLRERLSRLP